VGNPLAGSPLIRALFPLKFGCFPSRDLLDLARVLSAIRFSLAKRPKRTLSEACRHVAQGHLPVATARVIGACANLGRAAPSHQEAAAATG
jgi:hypothetical protein